MNGVDKFFVDNVNLSCDKCLHLPDSMNLSLFLVSMLIVFLRQLLILLIHLPFIFTHAHTRNSL